MDTAVSIDIGGTHTKLALVNKAGVIAHRTTLQTRDSTSVEAYVEDLFAAVERLLGVAADAASPVEGIGIGAPACNERDGTLVGTANLLFKDTYPIRDEMEARFRRPVRLLKDSSAAALGEHLFGGARGMDHFILLTLGTGLGSGIMAEGKLLRGATGLASEFGHANVDPEGRQCGCGRRGCLETYVSATGIVRTAFALMAETLHPSSLRRQTYQDTSAEDLFRAARAGDPIARLAFERTGQVLGRKITDLIVAFEPEAIFLSGGLAGAGELLLRPTREAAERHVLHLMTGKVDILRSTLGAHDAALLGAAATILHQPKEILS